MTRVGRATYWRIRLVPLAGFLLLGGAGGVLPRPVGEALATFSAVLFVAWIFLGGLLARWLVPLFVSTLTCPGCEDEIEAVGVWNCSCGYHDHRERHVLGRTCPKCGSLAHNIDCPRCSATILLW